jgi:conjugative transfer signal peptidase TraF
LRVTRLSSVVATSVATLVVGASALCRPAPLLIWNASASAPIGLYAVRPAGALRLAELVVVAPPPPLDAFLDKRRYLPEGVPLIKRILALPGQTVCRAGRMITVNGTRAGEALERDRLGRELPAWEGCRVIDAGDVFLMNRAPASLDGRYFGPLPATTIVGRADPLWTEKETSW